MGLLGLMGKSRKISFDGFLQAKVEGIADKCMTNADLICPGNLLVVVGKVLQRQVVTSVESQSYTACLFGSSNKGSDGSLTIGRIA